MASVVYGVTLATILPFVHVYTHGVTDVEYTNLYFALLFVLNGVFYNLKTPQGMLVIAAGLYKETRIQSTIQAAILLVGGVVLGFKFGLIGVMAASCLSNLYRCVDLLFFIPKTVTHLSVGPTLKNMIEMTSFAAAKTDNDPTRMGALLKIMPDGLSMVALDGYRIAQRNVSLEGNFEPKEMIIPEKSLTELARIIGDSDEDIKIIAAPGHAIFLLCLLYTSDAADE